MTTLERSSGPDEETVRIARKEFRRRRQAGRWRRARPYLLVVLALLLVAGAAWVVLASSLLTAERVAVRGNATLSTGRIERAAHVPLGTPLARVDLGAVRARVEAVPAVRRAEVSRAWPHTVRISVTERTPVAVIDQGSGLQALDADGVLFGGFAHRPPHLPLVVAPAGTGAEALTEGARVVASLPPRVARKVQSVQVASVDQISLVMAQGRRVLWGSAEQSDQKAAVLAVLLRRPGTQIDVSVPGRPTTR